VNLVRRFFRFVREHDKSALDIEIARVKAAVVRYQAELDEFGERFRREGWSCCPSCAFYPEYSNLADKADRAAEVLVRLLRKRGQLPDERLAAAVEMSAWP
jgi:hypothetical protein